MARPYKRLNDSSSETIESNFLKESPEGLPDEGALVIAKEIPKMRRVVFINGRDSGAPLSFHYSSATHPLKIYTLFHGQEVQLPEEVISHLEECGELSYGYRKGYDGCPEMYVKGKKYLFQFRNLKTA